MRIAKLITAATIVGALSIPAVGAAAGVGEREVSRWKAAGDSAAIVWNAEGNLFLFAFKEPCVAMAGGERPRMDGGHDRIIDGGLRDRLWFGGKACEIETVEEIDRKTAIELLKNAG